MAKDDFQKHTLNLRRGDWEKLSTFYPEVPVAIIIRKLVSRYIEQIEARGGSLDIGVEIKI